MRIVLTNDDGIDAPGLAALRSACEPFGDVVVVAPTAERSSCSHQVSYGELAYDDGHATGIALDGTPVDCARAALTHFAPDATVLLAGINRGGNLGADTWVSGTVAAAREAAYLGFPSVALSQYVVRDRPLDWELVSRRARRVLDGLLRSDHERGTFWNVNLPHPEHDADDLEVVHCPLDTSPLDVSFEANGRALRFTGDYHARRRDHGSDVDVCFGGRISISRLRLA